LSACALPFVERLNKGEAPDKVMAEALDKHKKLLKIEPTATSYEPKIAIIGGIPRREVVQYAFDSKGDWIIGRPAYDNFADSAGLIVNTLAPTAKLLFVPLGAESRVRSGSVLLPKETDIQKATRIAVEAGADIVLIPFPFTSKARLQTIELVATQALVVTLAPSQRSQERLKIEAEKVTAALVSSVDVDGQFKAGLLGQDETPIGYPGALSAPGMRIPRLAPNGMWQATFGTAYAAATAAAAFANILAATGRKAPQELLQRARDTSQHSDRRNPSVAIIDQKAALARPDDTTHDRATNKVCGS
jgi:hypothetical protein